MTVKELRQLLFDVQDQDSEVAIVLKTKYGVVEETKTVRTVEAEVTEAGNSFTLIRM